MQIKPSLLQPYLDEHYSKNNELVNTKMNYPVLKREFLSLKWDGKTQRLNNAVVIGCSEYGMYMNHHGTRSWCDNLPEYKINDSNKMKEFLRSPEWFEKMEKFRLLKKVIPLYEFMVYDFLDLGPMYFVKRQIMKFRNRRK